MQTQLLYNATHFCGLALGTMVSIKLGKSEELLRSGGAGGRNMSPGSFGLWDSKLLTLCALPFHAPTCRSHEEVGALSSPNTGYSQAKPIGMIAPLSYG